MAHHAVRPNSPEFHVHRGSLLSTFLGRQNHSFSVIGMDRTHEELEGRSHASRLQSEKPEHFVGPPLSVGDQVPLPAPHQGDALGLGQARLTRPQGGLGLLALLNAMLEYTDPNYLPSARMGLRDVSTSSVRPSTSNRSSIANCSPAKARS